MRSLACVACYHASVIQEGNEWATSAGVVLRVTPTQCASTKKIHCCNMSLLLCDLKHRVCVRRHLIPCGMGNGACSPLTPCNRAHGKLGALPASTSCPVETRASRGCCVQSDVTGKINKRGQAQIQIFDNLPALHKRDRRNVNPLC